MPTPTWIPVDRLPTSIGPRADTKARPYLWFIPCPGYRGTVVIGWPERWGDGHLNIVGANIEHDEQPSHFADCFDDTFSTPSEQAALARAEDTIDGETEIVHGSRDGGQTLICTGGQRRFGQHFVTLAIWATEDIDELITCPLCLGKLAASAHGSPPAPPIPSELPAHERIAVALERLADRLDRAPDEVVQAIDHYRRNVLGR